MPQLDLSLVVRLERHDLSDPWPTHGPIFHEFLPDGRKDAILLTGKADAVRVRVWFERLGFMRDRPDGFITFHSHKREIDPSTIARQAMLEGGPLWAHIEAEVTDDELAALRAGVDEDATYAALGKRLLRAAIPPIRAFVDVLRLTFGQYWLEKLRTWDSRTQSLGGYCSSLEIRWSDDAGKTWTRFLPNRPVIIVVSTLTHEGAFDDYLGPKDWEALDQMDWPSLAAEAQGTQIVDEVLSTAHQLLDGGNLRHGLIEAVVALELVIKTVANRRRTEKQGLVPVIDRLLGQGVAVQVMALPMIAPLAPFEPSDLENAVTAIDRRNMAMHEGWQPKASDEALVWSVLRVVGAALSPPLRRFPQSNVGNRLKARQEPPNIPG